MRRSPLLLTTLAAVLLGLGPGAPAQAAPAPDAVDAPTSPPLAAYAAPPFARECHFLRYGEGEPPPLAVGRRDPLCVEYAKRDITVDNGGAVRFLLAEPTRFAVAGQACRYWQLDHWSVQVDRADTAVVTWDGSYWFDRTRGTAGARLRNLAVDGRPTGVAEAVAVVRLVSPGLADYLQQYAGGPSGGGVALTPPPATLACPRVTQ